MGACRDICSELGWRVEDGQEAGIVHFNGGDEFTAFYVLQEGERKFLCLDWTDCNSRGNRMPYHAEQMKDSFVLNPDHEMPGGVDQSSEPVEIQGENIWLKSVIKEENMGIHELGEFLYSMDGIVNALDSGRSNQYIRSIISCHS